MRYIINTKTKTMKQYENEPFACVIPIQKELKIDDKPYPAIIGYWTIVGLANIDNANNNKFNWNILSATFKKSDLEKRDISYDDFYLTPEMVEEEISEHLHSNYQTRFVS